MMAEEGHELEGNAPCTQPPPLKIRSKIEILETQILLRKIEEMKQDAAHRSARNNHPRDLGHHSAIKIEEERGDEEPWSRRSFSANQAKHHENRIDLVSD